MATKFVPATDNKQISVSALSPVVPEWVTGIEYDHVHSRLKLEVRYHEITFDDLATLSELFGTRHISFHDETQEHGYCETCRYTETFTVIEVSQVTTWHGADE